MRTPMLMPPSPVSTRLSCEALNLQGCEPLTDQQQQELAGEEYCVGTGRVGVLARPLTLQELSEELAAALPATAGGLRVAGIPTKTYSPCCPLRRRR